MSNDSNDIGKTYHFVVRHDDHDLLVDARARTQVEQQHLEIFRTKMLMLHEQKWKWKVACHVSSRHANAVMTRHMQLTCTRAHTHTHTHTVYFIRDRTKYLKTISIIGQGVLSFGTIVIQSIPDTWSTSGPAKNGPYSRNDQCVVIEMTIFPKNLPTNMTI